MHKAKALLITCIDFRFHQFNKELYSKKEYLGKTDLLSVAGASRDFIYPLDPTHGEYVWRQLDLSIKLHDPEEIIICDHEECGAYAQDGMIPIKLTVKEDRAEHIKILKKLKPRLQKRYPNKTFIFLFAYLSGKIEKLEI